MSTLLWFGMYVLNEHHGVPPGAIIREIGVARPGGRAMYDRTKILDEGMQACLDGLPLASCPYHAGPAEREIRLEGWKCAADT